MRLLKKLFEKLLLLAQLFLTRPVEVIDRLKVIPETFFMAPFWIKRFGGLRKEYAVHQWETSVEEIKHCMASEDDILNEQALLEIQHHVMEQMENMGSGNVPFSLEYNADFSVARLCYLACRILKPSVVLETGVAYGVTTAFILKAMEMNGKGKLHSIDLPPLTRNAEPYIGYFVPETARHCWTLHRGSSRRILSQVLDDLNTVDMFISDSIATYRNVSYELRTVTPYLTDPAVVLVDDAGCNLAFLEWAGRNRFTMDKLIKKQTARTHFGLAVKTNLS